MEGWQYFAQEGVSAGNNALTMQLQQTFNKKNAEENFKRNKKLMDYQYSKELESWNRMNEYNSPASQMARYRDAGLNPNLVFSQGTPGNATVIPHYTAPEYNRKGLDVKIPQLQIAEGMAQVRLLNAEAKKKEMEALFAGEYYGGRASVLDSQAGIAFLKQVMSQREFDALFDREVESVYIEGKDKYENVYKYRLKPSIQEAFDKAQEAKLLRDPTAVSKTQEEADKLSKQNQWMDVMNMSGIANPALRTILSFLMGLLNMK